MNKTKGIIFLGVSILLEGFATSFLKMSNGMENIVPMLVSIVFFLLSLYLLGLSLEILPLSVAYAIWAGLGTTLTVLISVVLWGEVMSVIKLSGILLIVGGVIVLNFSEEKTE